MELIGQPKKDKICYDGYLKKKMLSDKENKSLFPDAFAIFYWAHSW